MHTAGVVKISGRDKEEAGEKVSERMVDVGPDLTPEQKLGAIIIQAAHGEYRHSVPRWAWELYANRVNFEALQSAFDEYLERRLEKK